MKTPIVGLLTLTFLLASSVMCQDQPRVNGEPMANREPGVGGEPSLNEATAIATANSTSAPQYDFENPTATFKLPHRLREISGLTLLNDSTIGAIEDEKGILYSIGIASGRDFNERLFSEHGDYEDLERVDRILYILRSDGVLFSIRDPDSATLTSTSFVLDLPDGCDAEGLAYRADRNDLLISCKENPGHHLRHHRAVYSFDLAGKREQTTPEFSVDLEQLGSVPVLGHRRSVGDRAFKPSAIAQHPITGDWFMVSSAQKTMLVLNALGNPAGQYLLPDSLFAQPEGLVFLPSGDLFVSNEAAGGIATVLRFNNIKQTE